MADKKLDNSLKLITGLPIEVHGIEIKPFKIGEIISIGYSDFQSKIQILQLTLDDIIDGVDDFETQAILKANKHNYTMFELAMISEGLKSLITESLSLFLRTEELNLIDDIENGVTIIVDGKYEINKHNFAEIASVIKMQNNPNVSKSENEDDYNPASEIAKGIAEKLKRGKEIVKKSKAMESNNDEGVDLQDVISAVTSMSNSINKININEYTLYQLYDEFARLVKIDNYRLQIQASMWASDVEVHHWSEPL